jgi:hypothetical protein
MPKPLAPCVCGSTEFLRAPLREHVGEMSLVEPVHFAVGSSGGAAALYLIGCRACGRVELRAPGLEHVAVDAKLGTEIVRFETESPYR